ncbi:MAG TPA: histidine kinase, partial [Phnomibacter sp.]|nr:histidine kinase [Phnomibacter sp.]
PYFTNAAIFQISPVALSGQRAYRFQYRISENGPWTTFDPMLPLSVQNIAKGNYVLEVQYSTDGQSWYPAQNRVAFTMPAAWWQRTWIHILAGILLAALLAYLWHNRRQRWAKRMQDERTERAILYLTTVIHRHAGVDEMLWDVARNCISQLGLEDCVIYLLDEEKGVLVQKAAWGPKAIGENEMVAPIEIPLGKGIVGSVAVSGVGEIVEDTGRDPRYITDDAIRSSELCVPIIDEGKVLGVMDSEHSRKHFFKQYHFTVLQTISSLLGSKIVKTKAEMKKKEAEIALAEMRQRAAEVEMQALRAQMNPHFLFNSLNSINNFILNNDVDNASAYLTRFSRLMRLILDNSRHDWVMLDQELQALELYIGMESLRFDNAFTWRIEVGEHIDRQMVQLPPLLIQPYVENAIWHGLLHRKVPGGHLFINIQKKGDLLEITIDDNGVGREAAAAKKQYAGHKRSHGMLITSERMQMVNKVYDAGAAFIMLDKKHVDGTPAGTLVQIKIKYRQVPQSGHSSS